MSQLQHFRCAGTCGQDLPLARLDPAGYCIACARGDQLPHRIAATMATREPPCFSVYFGRGRWLNREYLHDTGGEIVYEFDDQAGAERHTARYQAGHDQLYHEPLVVV